MFALVFLKMSWNNRKIADHNHQHEWERKYIYRQFWNVFIVAKQIFSCFSKKYHQHLFCILQVWLNDRPLFSYKDIFASRQINSVHRHLTKYLKLMSIVEHIKYKHVDNDLNIRQDCKQILNYDWLTSSCHQVNNLGPV